MKQEKSLQQLSDAELLILVCGEPKQQPKQDTLLERTWRCHQKNWRTLAKSTEWDLLEIYGLDTHSATGLVLCHNHPSGQSKPSK